MKGYRWTIRCAAWALMLCAVTWSERASAGEPDVRAVKPAVVLLLDTSGSMERKAGCTCSTVSCTECYPSGCGTATPERNRWAIAVESLTGTWTNYQCTRDDRSTYAATEFDFNYFMPHFRLPDIATNPQNVDGILDAYIDRVKFGIMTFDSVGTQIDQNPLVPWVTFTGAAFLAESNGNDGMYSYGGPKHLTFPGCGDNYAVDLGARSDTSPIGPLVSVGNDSGIPGYAAINATIQNEIVSIRPYGGTPIASMLDDFKYYLEHHIDVADPTVVAGGDGFFQCRRRYGLLITDGYPDSDFRDNRFRCQDEPQTATTGCPYLEPQDIAAQLCNYNSSSGECEGLIDGLFVIGFDIDEVAEPGTMAFLNDLADQGGTGQALFAENQQTLTDTLAQALNQAAFETTTRTVAAFAQSRGSAVSAGSTTSYSGGYQFQTGFNVGTAAFGSTPETPWNGVLERRRLKCDPSTLQPVEQNILDQYGDRFQARLNAQQTRNIYTVFPSTNVAAFTQTIVGQYANVAMESLNNTTKLLPAIVGAGVDTTRRNQIIDWVYATSSPRSSYKLADIYHSSPVVVGAPTLAIADESYKLFRESVAWRPSVVYIGTNDGALHAFSVEDFSTTAPGAQGATDSFTAGQELWAFVPPLLLPKLNAASTAHQYMLDGTPVVKDVFYHRVPGQYTPNANLYHTVLVVGPRGGGKGYVALDVTDPRSGHVNFLWQFYSANMGLSYGRAALGQAHFDPGLSEQTMNVSGGTQERAIAVIPGGTGELIPNASLDATQIAQGCTPTGAGLPTGSTRSRVRCWKPNIGRELYVVDVETGALLRTIGGSVFNSPLVGSAVLYPGNVGTTATAAYVTDADGVIWRIDLSNVDPHQWTAQPMFDMYGIVAGDTAFSGQPSYEPPIISIDSSGNVVLIHATGDTDALDGSASNRVVSVTEHHTSSSGQVTWSFTENWHILLDTSEQVTGPLELFDGYVYFASFKSVTNPLDLCDLGQSRLWGVHFRDHVSVADPAPGLESIEGSGVRDATYIGPYSNQLIMGVGITQRPECIAAVNTSDPVLGNRLSITGAGGGDFMLVAQVAGAGAGSAGASIRTLTRQVQTPISQVRHQSWAGSAD